MSLTREQILAAQDLELKRVPVPEWGGDVYVRQMSAGQQAAWEDLSGATKDGAEVIALLLSQTLCDESGNLLFSADDIQALKGKNAKVMIRLKKDVYEVNGITPEDVDTLAKNSDAAHPDSSSSS